MDATTMTFPSFGPAELPSAGPFSVEVVLVAKNEERTLKFRRIVYNWGDAALIECENEDGQYQKLIGPVEPEEIDSGVWYRFYGSWREHEKYGEQFRFKTFVESTPLDPEGMVKYLARIEGMTEARAKRVVKAYEANSIRMLRERPEEVRETINLPSFTQERADAASAALKERQHVESTMVELIGLLAGKNFRAEIPKLLIEEYGNRALQAVKDNPYLLLNYPGVGFPTADGLYLSLEKDPAAIERQGLCAWYKLKEERGHTWLGARAVKAELKSKIGGAEVRFKEAIRWARDGNWVKARRDEEGDIWLAEFYRADSERKIAERAAFMLDFEPDWPDIGEAEGISPHQAEQLNKALHRNLGIFGGGPGTGKTYTAARLIGRIQAADPYEQIALCAPTGKAANRLTEVVNSYGVGLHATTIHRLLQVRFQTQTTYQFVHGPQDPLPHKYVIVDEASMLDTDLCGYLIDAMPTDGHLLLIGDIDQLPPVGHGAPLRDLIRSGKVPYGYLTEIIRNSGAIVRTCRDIRENKRIALPAALDVPSGENLMIYRETNEGATISRMLSILERVKANQKNSPIWDVQILVATNKSNALSRLPINDYLQGKLNADNRSDSRFWEHDKVVCEKNNWFPAVNEFQDIGEDVISQINQDGRLHIFVANGELGKVVRDEPRRTMVEFLSPKRLVVVPRGEGKESLALGYAISGHKSQGSEWPIVIVLLDPSSSARDVCDRAWIYTAISRAKLGCILIGSDATFHAMRARNTLWDRKTLLVERLREELTARRASRRPQDSVPAGEEAAEA